MVLLSAWATRLTVVDGRLMMINYPVASVSPLWPTSVYIVGSILTRTLGAGFPSGPKASTGMLMLQNNIRQDWKNGFPRMSRAATAKIS